MKTGIVFDIKEFAVHDGPGIRTTVFLKGCPLDCSWCHNPEGKSRQPQTMRSSAGERTAGQEFTSQELASRLIRQAGILKANEGGVTFSGGEPLQQAEFLVEVIPQLNGLHILLDTSGYGRETSFRRLVELSDLVYFDLKIIDDSLHCLHTGRSNRRILGNLRLLGGSGKPFVIRIPLIPGVTDTDQNLEAIAATVRRLPGLLRVDLLPYNPVAGGKYLAAGIPFRPRYDPAQPVKINTAFFEDLGLKVRVA
ncbi:MAG TPA: radical SAM protein [Anaerolineales bacterium]|nr:radical SAM protein [Anaerolineales bacterium]